MSKLFGKTILCLTVFAMLLSLTVYAEEINYRDYDFIGYKAIDVLDFNQQSDADALFNTLTTAEQGYTTYVGRTRLYKNSSATDSSGKKGVEWVENDGVDGTGCLKFNKAAGANAWIRTYGPSNITETAFQTRGMKFSADVKCVGAQATGTTNASCIIRWWSNVNSYVKPAEISVRGAGTTNSHMAIHWYTSSGEGDFTIDNKPQLSLLNTWITLEIQINFDKQTALLRAVNKETGEIIGEAEKSYLVEGGADRIIQMVEIASQPNKGEVLVDNIKYEYDRYEPASPEVKVEGGAVKAYARVQDMYAVNKDVDNVSSFLPDRKIILAIYKDKKLIDVNHVNTPDSALTLTATDIENVYTVNGISCEISTDGLPEGCTAKAMLLDDFSTIKPLCACSETVNVN